MTAPALGTCSTNLPFPETLMISPLPSIRLSALLIDNPVRSGITTLSAPLPTLISSITGNVLAASLFDGRDLIRS